MALDNKKYEKFYSTSGDGADKAQTAKLIKAERDWDFERATGCEFYLTHPDFAPLIFQLQQMQDEITALRTEISANKDKVTFPGFGTSSTTALAGDTTVISSDQASAITANTAKVGIASVGVADGNLTISLTDGTTPINTVNVVGPAGETGATGPAGIQGETGAQGIQGETGATGAQGIPGKTGAQGIQGKPGADGADGIPGFTFTIDSENGSLIISKEKSQLSWTLKLN